MANWTKGVMLIEGKVKDLRRFRSELKKLNEENDFEYYIVNMDEYEEDWGPWNTWKEWEEIKGLKDDDWMELCFYVRCKWSFEEVEERAEEEDQNTLLKMTGKYNLSLIYKGYEPAGLFLEVAFYNNGDGSIDYDNYEFYYNDEEGAWEIDCENFYAYDILNGELDWLESECPNGKEREYPDVKDIMEDGELLKKEWDWYVGVDDKTFIGLTSTYEYKGRVYAIDFEYQNVTKDKYDPIPENIEEIEEYD